MIDPPASAKSIPGPGDDMQEPVFKQVSSVSQTSQGTMDTGHSAQYNMAPIVAASSDSAGAGAMAYPEQEYSDSPEHPLSDEDFSDEDNSLAEEGDVSSDNLERQEQTEDMTFRETVRSVRSFMGWDFIPVFESDLLEPDKSNNPWRGKHPRKPARISVAMPPDDWLCQKMEKVNTTIAEGYPSRARLCWP